jgi:hypothetical protein
MTSRARHPRCTSRSSGGTWERDDVTWADPVWEFYEKHRPPSRNAEDWPKWVEQTGRPKHKSYYHYELWPESISECELKAVLEGVFLSRHGPVKYYWYEHDRVIGASNGEETKFGLAEYHQAGYVHGHPVTWQELKKKGARDEDRRS